MNFLAGHYICWKPSRAAARQLIFCVLHFAFCNKIEVVMCQAVFARTVQTAECNIALLMCNICANFAC